MAGRGGRKGGGMGVGAGVGGWAEMVITTVITPTTNSCHQDNSSHERDWGGGEKAEGKREGEEGKVNNGEIKEE